MLPGLLLLLSLCILAHGDSPSDGCVVVTGASGFLASHIVRDLLLKGYLVHGTVRNVNDPSKLAFLNKMEKEIGRGKLELFQAELGDDNAFDAAAKGCWGMLHTAAMVLSDGTPPEEQVRLTEKGTISALEAARKNKIRSVVLTASVATVAPMAAKLSTSGYAESATPYDESCWNDVATLHYGTYSYSKLKAERSAIEWVKTHGTPFRYSSIHFPVGFGPQLDKRVTSSNNLVKILVGGEVPFNLPMQLVVVDIRDVARAHIHVLEHERANGRYIVSVDPKNAALSLSEIAQVLSRQFPTLPIPRLDCPMWLARLLILVERRIDAYQLDVAARGRHIGYDGSRITKELGFVYEHTSVEDTLHDAARSMLDLGIVDGSSKPLPVVYVLLSVAMALLLCVSWCAIRCCRPLSATKLKSA